MASRVTARKLAAIMVADIAGFSRMMEHDESSTFARLRQLRDEVTHPKVGEHGGRLIKTTGDGFLAEFPSAANAVQCALAIQRDMVAREAGRSVDARIRLRIGINVGDVIVDGDDVAGDGVNIAARLEPLAPPDGICISAYVREQLHDELGMVLADLGEQHLKNIARPIRAFAVTLATGSGAAGTTRAALAVPATGNFLSIAVLPFVNRSNDEEDEYFSDGLADELLNVLAKIPGLRVAARSSAFTFKGKNATVAEVGRALNVATVLEGSLRKSGNRLRISVQLAKVADGYHLWSETYDRTLEDIFAMQDDIAQSVVKELRTTLLGEAAHAQAGNEVTAAVTAAAKGRSTNPEAHRLFLQARHLINRQNREDVAKGLGYLKEALALEPEFALAWAVLGLGYEVEADKAWVPFSEGFGRAREAVAHALALEPDLAEGHAGMGWIQMMHDWDWRGAEASYRRALELAPGDALVLRRAGVLAYSLGRLDEAIALARRAIEQDPLSTFAYRSLGGAFEAAGSLAEAETAHKKGLELAPSNYLGAHATLALILRAQGRHEEALAEAMKESEEWYRFWALAIIHHAAGHQAESDAALQELIANHAMSSAFQVAEVHAMRGETDLAFEWLDRAYGQRDPGLSYMKPDPLLRSLHADPRWEPFLRKMGLAD